MSCGGLLIGLPKRRARTFGRSLFDRTSFALSGDEAKAMAAGADAYVTKPFSPRALLAKIRQFLP